MELIEILRKLWDRKLLVAVAAALALLAGVMTAYRVSVSPPGLSERSLKFGAAQTQLLIDQNASALISVNRDLEPLATRAQVFSAVVKSQEIANAIAMRAGVEPGQLAIENDASISETRSAAEATSAERSNQLLFERSGYRLFFSAESGLPILSVSATAPTAAEAIGLADAATAALNGYLLTAQGPEASQRGSSVVIRRLGNAVGGPVNQGANVVTAGLATVGVFVFLCILILVVSGAVSDWRSGRGRRPDHAAYEPTNGHVWPAEVDRIAERTGAR